MVFVAVIHEWGPIPESETAEVQKFTELPEELTYPELTVSIMGYINQFAPH